MSNYNITLTKPKLTVKCADMTMEKDLVVQAKVYDGTVEGGEAGSGSGSGTVAETYNTQIYVGLSISSAYMITNAINLANPSDVPFTFKGFKATDSEEEIECNVTYIGHGTSTYSSSGTFIDALFFKVEYNHIDTDPYFEIYLTSDTVNSGGSHGYGYHEYQQDGVCVVEGDNKFYMLSYGNFFIKNDSTLSLKISSSVRGGSVYCRYESYTYDPSAGGGSND